VKVRWFALLAITLAILGMMALLAGTASADGGVHNFSTTSVTSNCAGCHRVHTAIGSGLLKATTAYDLCTSCHGPTGTDADVVDGVYKGAPLRGGGFINATMAISYTTPVSGTSTSAHKVLGMPGYAPGTSTTVWGIGAKNSGAGLVGFNLECSTCHDPHGKAGTFGGVARQATYRILRCDFGTISQLVGAGVVNGNCVPDTSTHNYNITDTTTDKYYGQHYSSVSDNNTDDGNMQALSAWCSSCHTRIHTSDAVSHPGSTASGDSIFTYRHITTGTSVEYNFGTSTLWPSGSPGCMTCHVSHGSDAILTSGSAKNVPFPGTAEGGGSYIDTALMRLSQRGVCEACHNK
jgi:predicted CXXCH cytochrome family protein